MKTEREEKRRDIAKLLANYGHRKSEHYTALQELLDEIGPRAQKLLRKRANQRSAFAPHFNLFEILGIDRREVKTHSATLRFLFDPLERHEQGDRFILALIERINLLSPAGHEKISTEHSEHWRSRAEVSIHKGRIDIIIDNLVTRTCIVVENKIGAKDQEEQLSKYWNWLQDREQKQLYDQRILVYLTPLGTIPSPEALDKSDRGKVLRSLILLSYRNDISAVIGDDKSIESKSLQVFLSHYTRTIQGF